MAYLACDRDQEMLLPPSLREWLPADHVAWFLIDVIGQLDLSAFYGEGLAEGPGRPAYDPQMMVTLLVYAYSRGERSARVIEKRCWEDVAYRVICANRMPDHSTVSRFRKDHQQAFADLFEAALALCRRAGMVKVGKVAVDGTRIAGNAGLGANRSYPAIRAEIERILVEAEETDEREDGLFGPARGDELPEELADPNSRVERLKRAKRDIDEEQKAREEAYLAKLEAREQRRSRAKDQRGGRPPSPPKPEQRDQSKRNITDPESRIMNRRGALVQGYNAQLVVGEGQLILAAEVTNSSSDNNQLLPSMTAARENLSAIEHTEPIEWALGDGGYWNSEQIAAVRATGTEVLVPTKVPHNDGRRKKAPPSGPQADRINEILETDDGRRLYRQRAGIVEPVFAHMRHHRRFDRFSRRGREAADQEWKLAAAVHNLMKLFKYQPEMA